jgi:hypothetical protein
MTTYQYDAKTNGVVDVGSTVAIRDDQSLVAAFGNFALDGVAAHLLFDRLKNPVSETKERNDKLLYNIHWRSGLHYSCSTVDWDARPNKPARTTYWCQFDMLDVSKGIMREFKAK